MQGWLAAFLSAAVLASTQCAAAVHANDGVLNRDADAARTSGPFMGVEELLHPTFTSKRHGKLNVTRRFPTKNKGDDRVLQMTYDVEHAHDAFMLSLDDVLGLDAVVCSDDSASLELEFTSTAAANALLAQVSASPHTKVIISGTAKWGCAKKPLYEGHQHHPLSSPHGIILRKASFAKPGAWPVATSSGSTTSATVTIATQPAGYTDVFKNAKIRFRSGALPPCKQYDHDMPANYGVVEHTLDAAAPGAPSTRRSLDGCSWWDVGCDIAKAVSFVVKKAEAVVATVVNVVKDVVEDTIDLLVDGGLSANKTWVIESISWNSDGNGGAKNHTISLGYTGADDSISASATCTDCFLDTNLDLIFELDIVEYKMHYLKIAAEGSIAGRVGVHAEASATKSFNASKTVATLHVPDFDLPILGIPVSFSITVPVSVGLDATIQANAVVAGFGQASGAVLYGVQYNASASGWSLLQTKSFNCDGNFTELSGSATAAISVYVEPVVSIVAEHIGGPTFGLKPHIDGVAIGEIDKSFTRAAHGSDASPSSAPSSSPGLTSPTPERSSPTPSPSAGPSQSPSLYDFVAYQSSGSYSGSGGAFSWYDVDYSQDADRNSYGTEPRALEAANGDPCPNGISAALSWGFSGSIGFEIDVTILGLTLFNASTKPATLFSVSKPISPAKCFPMSSMRRLQALDDGEANKQNVKGTSLETVSATARQASSFAQTKAYSTVEVGDLFSGAATDSGYTSSGECAALFGGEVRTFRFRTRVLCGAPTLARVCVWGASFWIFGAVITHVLRATLSIFSRALAKKYG